MRHRIGIVLAVAMLATLFFAGGWGYLRLLRLPPGGGALTGLPGHALSDHRALLAMLAVAGTGLLAGLLVAVPRVSPLAAGIPGLVLLGWTGFYLVNVRQAVDLIPLRSDTFGSGFEAMLFNGTLAAAGLAMIVPMVVPSRWRRRAASADTVTYVAPQDTVPTLSGNVVPAPAFTMPSGSMSAPVSTVPAGAPVTRLERVASAPSGATGPIEESPWVVGQRAAGRPDGPL